MLDDQSGEVVGVLSQGDFDSHCHEQKINFKNTPLATIILTMQTATYPGVLVKKLLLPFPTYKNIKTSFECLCFPLLGSEVHSVTGIVVLINKIEIPFSSECLQILKMLAPLMAIIMEEVIQGRQRMIELATKDTLTNLYTLPYFEIRVVVDKRGNFP